jgi:hypothetical protein
MSAFAKQCGQKVRIMLKKNLFKRFPATFLLFFPLCALAGQEVIDSDLASAKDVVVAHIVSGTSATGSQVDGIYRVKTERSLLNGKRGEEIELSSRIPVKVGGDYVLILFPEQFGRMGVRAALEVRKLHRYGKPEQDAVIISSRDDMQAVQYVLPGVTPESESIQITDNTSQSQATYRLTLFSWYPLSTFENYVGKAVNRAK